MDAQIMLFWGLTMLGIVLFTVTLVMGLLHWRQPPSPPPQRHPKSPSPPESRPSRTNVTSRT